MGSEQTSKGKRYGDNAALRDINRTRLDAGMLLMQYDDRQSVTGMQLGWLSQ